MTSMIGSCQPLKFKYAVALLALGTCCGTLFGQADKDSQQLTIEAWQKFNKPDYKAAIAKAEECIDKFKDDADEKQDELKKKNTSEPPTDTFSDSERNEIVKRGPLNDVATSFFIIGQSEEELYKHDKDPQHIQRAKDAYTQACRYTYARTWNAKGFFWSPSRKACRRKDKL
jgi:hypothetical protein